VPRRRHFTSHRMLAGLQEQMAKSKPTEDHETAEVDAFAADAFNSEPEMPAPIDQIIRNLDDAVNTLREQVSTLQPSGPNNATKTCLNALQVIQAFQREVRRLLGDII
jgi:hypothetical protein